ncbi:fimbrial protein [Pseudomonas chlororaphis]|uniref:fimbrial protein n=1 Tax=Pseudomonas chlororaphis TaxID=587753 RepID=UPI00236779DC|nr:fimbrial protein [Pseudomonas chlororaphis]WDH50944.1 fimbrial protein [Pseudomonas chlororaphis]
MPKLQIEYKQGSYESQVYTLTVKAPISIVSKGCRVTTPAINVPMPKGIIASQEVPGSLFGSKSFNIDLADCSADVKVYIALTDASNPSNSSETLSLSPASTAKGVGFRVTHEGKVVSFAPDSSAPGTLNQWLVTNRPAAFFSIPMEVSYIRTNKDIQAGTAIGNITFNMSYQ